MIYLFSGHFAIDVGSFKQSHLKFQSQYPPDSLIKCCFIHFSAANGLYELNVAVPAQIYVNTRQQGLNSGILGTGCSAVSALEPVDAEKVTHDKATVKSPFFPEYLGQ